MNQKENSILVGTSFKSPLNSPVSSQLITTNSANSFKNNNVNLKPKIIIQDETSVSKISNNEDENLNKKLNDLKVTCTQSNLQMKYKKNSASVSKSKMKTRSRSHSRGKYSAYLASAATAIKTAIKISPNSSKTQILTTTSTQTCSKIVSSSNNETTNQMKLENNYEENFFATTASNIISFTDGRPIKTFMPSRSDFFIWYSSVRGFVSMRDPDGSPFIKCLVTVFSRCAYELELVEMVRKVNMLMQQYEMNTFNDRNAVAQYFMVPVPEYHLTKRLYFNP